MKQKKSLIELKKLELQAKLQDSNVASSTSGPRKPLEFLKLMTHFDVPVMLAFIWLIQKANC